MLRQVITNSDRSPHNAVCLGIAAALVSSRFEMSTHLVGHEVDDLIQTLFFVRVDCLLCQLQILIFTPQVDQELNHPCSWLAKQPVQQRAKPGFQPAFDMHQFQQDAVNEFQDAGFDRHDGSLSPLPRRAAI